jgi:hypothetical protein
LNASLGHALRGLRVALACLSLVASGVEVKIPLDKIIHATDGVVNRIQNNVEVALNKVASLTMDHWGDGNLFRRPLGVNSANLLTSSGIAPYSIQASNVGSGALLGSNIATGTVAVSNLATANQFSVYRTAAFTCPAGVYSALYGDSVVKDVAGGWSQANAWYVIPAAGDWQFQWSAGLTPANSGKEVFTALVINSGLVNGSVGWSNAASQTQGSVGSYLYVNALAGDKIKVQVWNGDSGSLALAVGSGNNYFQGYQLR